MRQFLFILIIMVFSMSNSAAQTQLTTPAAGSELRQNILDAARAPANKDLGKPVQFDVQTLKVLNGWAFVSTKLQEADGQAFSYVGTPFEEAAERGLQSNIYVALLKDKQGTWEVTTYKIGPTDLAWLTWPADFGAPEALFQPDN